MQPNKVYESLAHLANNIIKNEKLRYELFDNELFKDQFVKQINNMLALEKDFNQELYGEKWATIFAKAIVKIIGIKQRFEKPDGKSIEEIYADYSSFLSYTTTTFIVGRNELIDDAVKFTEQDILYIAVLSEDTKEKYRNLAQEKIAEEQATKTQNQTQNFQNKQSDSQQINNNENTYFGGNFGSQQGFTGMPVHPMQNPRFYPYNAKPKWMPLMKYVLAVVVIISSIMLMAVSIAMMSLKFDFSDKAYGDALIGSRFTGENWDDFLRENTPYKTFPLNWILLPINFMSILNFIIYVLPAAYIAYIAFKKPKNLSDKYRLQMFPVILVIAFFAILLFQNVKYVNSSSIKEIFRNNYNVILKNPKDVGDGFNYDFNAFWEVAMDNYGVAIKTFTAIVDTAISISSVAIIVAIGLLIFNPKIDRQKMAQANMEFQKAAMAAMQGQTYEMDQSLYENEDEIINHKTSKFAAWWRKNFKKKNHDKNQDN